MLGADNSQLLIGVTQSTPDPDSPCYKHVQPEVAETDTSITITLHLTVQPPGNCPAVAVPSQPISVTLMSPYSSRKLIDGATGTQRPLDTQT